MQSVTRKKYKNTATCILQTCQNEGAYVILPAHMLVGRQSETFGLLDQDYLDLEDSTSSNRKMCCSKDFCNTYLPGNDEMFIEMSI